MPGLVSRARPPGGGAGASLRPAVPAPLRWHGAGCSALRAAARHPAAPEGGPGASGEAVPQEWKASVNEALPLFTTIHI